MWTKLMPRQNFDSKVGGRELSRNSLRASVPTCTHHWCPLFTTWICNGSRGFAVICTGDVIRAFEMRACCILMKRSFQHWWLFVCQSYIVWSIWLLFFLLLALGLHIPVPIQVPQVRLAHMIYSTTITKLVDIDGTPENPTVQSKQKKTWNSKTLKY